MQVALRFRQARLRADRRESLRQHARRFGAVAGELLALASLGLALAAGLMLLTGLLG
jgi:hypothetical protein